MGLFSRKKSSANVSSSRAERAPSMPAAAIPDVGTSMVMRLELSPEVSTPLYERFTRANGQGTEDSNRLSLGLFDGSTVKGRAAASLQLQTEATAASGGLRTLDPLDDVPPSSFRDIDTSAGPLSQRRFADLSAAPGPKVNDYNMTFMQAGISNEQGNPPTNAPLGPGRRASQSLGLPRVSNSHPSSRLSPSPNPTEQRKPDQSARRRRSRTLDGSSAGPSNIATTMPPIISAPKSAHAFHAPSSSGNRQSTSSFWTNTSSPNPPTVPSSPNTRNPSIDAPFYPDVPPQMYNDGSDAAYLPHLSQPIPQQQQEPQTRIPHRSKTRDTPPATISALSADRSPKNIRHQKPLSGSAMPTSPPADDRYRATPREHRSRAASASYQSSAGLTPSAHSYAHIQAHIQAHMHTQRPTLPSSPYVSGTSAGAPSHSGTGTAGIQPTHMLRRQSRSIISSAVSYAGGGNSHGGGPERANDVDRVSRSVSPSKPSALEQYMHNVRESRIPGSSSPSTSASRDRDAQMVDTPAGSNSKRPPSGLEWPNDALVVPGSSSASERRVRSSSSPKGPTHVYANSDMVASMSMSQPPVPPPPPKQDEPGVAGVGAAMRRLSMNMNSGSNGYIHHPPQTTYMYPTQPLHTHPPGGPVPPPTSFPSAAAAAAAQHQSGGGTTSLLARGDSTTSSRTTASALSNGTVRSPAPSSRTSVSNGGADPSARLSLTPTAAAAAATTYVSPMSLDPRAHVKMMKEQEREKKKEDRKTRKKRATALEHESTSLPPPPSSSIATGVSTPVSFEAVHDPTTISPTAEHVHMQPPAEVVNIIRMSRVSEDRLSDVMRAGEDDPFARVVTPAPGNRASGVAVDDIDHLSYDDVMTQSDQLQPPQASSSSRRAPSSHSLSHSNLDALSSEPSLPLPSHEDVSTSLKKSRKHRSERDKGKDGERKHRSRSSKHAEEGDGNANGEGDGERRHHRKHRTKEPIKDDGLVPVRKHRSHRDKDKDKDKDSERRHRKRRHHHDEQQPLSSEPIPAGADVPAQLDTANGSARMDPSLSIPTSTNGDGSSSPKIEPAQVENASDSAAEAPSERHRDHERENEGERERRHQHRRSKRERHHRHESQNEVREERPRKPRYYPLAEHLCNPGLLAPLLAYLTFADFYALWNSTRRISKTMEGTPDLREIALEKFLSSVGYRRWTFSERREPVSLTLKELNAYLRGVTVPTHHYPMIAADYLHLDPTDPRADDARIIAHQMAASTRAYTRLVIRLRAQAELEQMQFDVQQESMPPEESPSPAGPISMPTPRHANDNNGNGPPVTLGPRYGRVNSSSASVSDSGHGHYSHPPVSRAGSAAARYRSGRHQRSASVARSVAPSINSTIETGNGTYGGGVAVRGVYRFRSPLFKLGHAPLLRVFVPNREGIWLSDDNVVKCEQELSRAGVTPFLKVGDVIWDVAVGDENNIGRMIWDGAYLIDLDYTYSLSGEIPPYIDSLCFPPSYWHKILRIAGDPIVYINIQPYANEVAANLALLQSRVQTETPQGSYHTVVRWIYRSSFQLRSETPLLPHRPTNTNPSSPTQSQSGGRTPMIDQAWEGTVFVEAEGTIEGLEELQERIGPDVQITQLGKQPPPQQEQRRKGRKTVGKTVFRMIRAQSRPGELWLRCAREKEKVFS